MIRLSPRLLLPRAAVALFAVGALLIGDPAGFAAKKHDAPDVVSDALAFSATDRDRAIKMLEQAITDNPAGQDVDALMVNAGEQRRLSGDAAGARRWFVKVITHGVPSSELESAKLGVALLDAQTSLDPKVVETLQLAPEKDVIGTENADRYVLLAVVSAKQNDPKGVSSWGKKALTYARDDDALYKRISARLDALAPTGGGGSGGNPAMAGKTPLQQAEELYKSGDREGARSAAETASATSQGPEKVQADGLLANLASGPEDANKIAVILPLSGDWGAVGTQMKDAIQYGYVGAGRQLVFVDTLGTAEGVVAAVDRAVKVEHAIAILGPLLTDETDAAVAEAETLHVPLLSLSQSYEDTQGHYWAVSGMYTRADQVNSLVTYVMGPDRLMKSFAMYTNDSPSGVHAAELFRKAVESRGGTIATAAVYSNTETSLRQYASTLGVREGDLATLRAQAKAQGADPGSVVVPPVLNFDAIYIPDSATRTPLACASLAVEEFSMGDFTPHKGMKKIPLLGLSGWNTATIVATGNEYTRSSVFTDVFSSTVVGDADPFVVAYKASTNRTPTALEAAVVDAARLLASAARSTAKTRPAFRDAILAATNSDAVTGATKFDPTTLRAARKMLILTVNRTTIAQLGTVDVP